MEVLSMLKHSLVADGANPITKHFTLVKHVASAGPELIWKIYDATRNSDGRDVSVFLFEKRVADKLHKPKRRELVAEILRREVKQLSRLKHPKILKVIHPLEECHDSIAFATEPVLGSLANLLGCYDRMPTAVPQDIKENSFLEVEIKYGLLQIAEALSFLHGSEHLLHGNVSPQSILVTRRGMWKLMGMGFAERPKDGKQDAYPLISWTSKSPKMAQPDLDYISPEIQLETAKHANTVSDMYSLGMVICAIYNQGHPIIQANHNCTAYAKQIDKTTELFGDVAHRIPIRLVEPVEKMINKDVRYRPTAQQFMMLKYFDDPVVRCMQMLDAVDSKDLPQKCEFFNTLAQAIPQFPRKLLYNSVFPMLKEQLEYPDMMVLVLPAMVAMIEHSSSEDYKGIIQPEFKKVFNMTRPVQATVYLLEKLDLLMAKATEEDMKSDVLPMIFATLESNSIQGQEAAISVFTTIKKYLDDQTMRKLVLPKAKSLFQKSTNIRTRLNALACVDRLVDSLDKMLILDEVVPFLTEINCQDVDIIMSVIAIYRHLLSDKKFGLTHNLLATKVMPTLIPYTVIPGLTFEQFSQLMEVLREMLEQIDRQRRNKMLLEAPDHDALQMRRSSLQQMYYLASRAHAMRLPEEYRMLASMGKRPSWGSSNSSIASAWSTGRYSPRRTSIDMRYNVFDPPNSESASTPKYLLSVDEAYYSKYRRGHGYNRFGYRQAPSTPELQTRTGSQESLGPRAYRRHSSFQGLGMEEQAVLEKIVRERRASLTPSAAAAAAAAAANNPHILVSEPSVSDFDTFFCGTPRRASTQSVGAVVVPVRRPSEESFFYATPRRASTQSIGPIVVPEGRRDSRGRLLDLQQHQRRSSFQGICESAMQFFVGK